MKYKFKAWHLIGIIVVLFLLYQGGFIKGFGAWVFFLPPSDTIEYQNDQNYGAYSTASPLAYIDQSFKTPVNAVMTGITLGITSLLPAPGTTAVSPIITIRQDTQSGNIIFQNTFSNIQVLNGGGDAPYFNIGALNLEANRQYWLDISAAPGSNGMYISISDPAYAGTTCTDCYPRGILTYYYNGVTYTPVNADLTFVIHGYYPNKADGESCTLASECTGGYCVDDTCASTSCPVIFRTNVINGHYELIDGSVWIAFDKNNDGVLEGQGLWQNSILLKSYVDGLPTLANTPEGLKITTTTTAFVGDDPDHLATTIILGPWENDPINRYAVSNYIQNKPEAASAITSISPVPGYEGKEVYAAGATGCPSITPGNDDGEPCTLASECTNGWCVGDTCASSGDFKLRLSLSNTEASSPIEAWINSHTAIGPIGAALGGILSVHKIIPAGSSDFWETSVISGSALAEGANSFKFNACALKGTFIQNCIDSSTFTITKSGQVIS